MGKADHYQLHLRFRGQYWHQPANRGNGLKGEFPLFVEFHQFGHDQMDGPGIGHQDVIDQAGKGLAQVHILHTGHGLGRVKIGKEAGIRFAEPADGAGPGMILVTNRASYAPAEVIGIDFTNG